MIKSYLSKVRISAKISCLVLLLVSSITTGFGQLQHTINIDESGLRAGEVEVSQTSGIVITSTNPAKAVLSMRFDDSSLKTADGLKTIPLSSVLLKITGSYWYSKWDNRLLGAIMGDAAFGNGERVPEIKNNVAFGLTFRFVGLKTQNLQAGDYTVGYSLMMSNLNDIVSATRGTLKISVPLIISFGIAPTDVDVKINDFKYFRGTSPNLADPTANQNISVFHTQTENIWFSVPSFWFSVSNAAYGANVPEVKINDFLKSQITGPNGNIQPVSFTSLANYTVTVPTGNLTPFKLSFFNLTATEMKNSFLNKGTYKTNLMVHRGFSVLGKPIDVSLTVSDMGELSSGPGTNGARLVFKSYEDYQNGVKSDGRDYLIISKTTPYDVYAKASASSLSSGANNIPLDILGVRPFSSADGDVKTISNLSTVAQPLIKGGTPVVDRKIFLQYFISADKAQSLLNPKFKADTYVVDLTYSFTGI